MAHSRSILLLTVIGIFIFFGSAGFRPAEADEGDGCRFDRPNLPDDAVIWVGAAEVGYALPGEERSQQRLSDRTTKVEVVINSPDRPVAVILSSHHNVVWNFRWTEGTKIAAVIIRGEAGRAVGLPDETSLIIADWKAPECRIFSYPFATDTGSLSHMNSISLLLVGKKPSRYFWARAWRLVMGDEDYDPATLVSADARLHQTPLRPLPSWFKSEARPRGNHISIVPEDDWERVAKQSPRLQESLRKKHLRVLRRETMEAWLDKYIQLFGLQNYAVDGPIGFSGKQLAAVNGYEVVSQDFRLSDVCVTKSDYHIFFPDTMDISADFFPSDFNIGECRVYFGRSGYLLRGGHFLKLWQSLTLGVLLLHESFPMQLDFLVIKPL